MATSPPEMGEGGSDPISFEISRDMLFVLRAGLWLSARLRLWRGEAGGFLRGGVDGGEGGGDWWGRWGDAPPASPRGDRLVDLRGESADKTPPELGPGAVPSFGDCCRRAWRLGRRREGLGAGPPPAALAPPTAPSPEVDGTGAPLHEGAGGAEVRAGREWLRACSGVDFRDGERELKRERVLEVDRDRGDGSWCSLISLVLANRRSRPVPRRENDEPARRRLPELPLARGGGDGGSTM
mmetsp:Transcript_5634/g.16577  ORF Transcript_5634/g.16577 Transcript_5634/m.16577 type:complete len:239 (-) Transcript_5634:632-1348(-)